MRTSGFPGVLTIFLILFAVCSVTNVFPVSIEDLIDPRYAAQLRAEESLITEVQLKNPDPKLLPRQSELRRFVTDTQNDLNPNILVETLYIYKKPSAGKWSDEQRTAFYNRLLAISTLAGIEYFSASRNSMRTFYEASYVIDTPNGRKAIPDPFYPQPPLSLTLYARQKDLTFGDNIYRYDYLTTGDAIFFSQENITPMSYGIVQVVGRNRLRSIMAVIDTDDSLLIYAVSAAKTASFPGAGDRIGNSFSNRAEAVLKWFSAGADIVFKSAD